MLLACDDLKPSDGKRDLASDAVVEKRAVLEIITTDEAHNSLRSQVRSDGAGHIHPDWRANDFHLDRIYVRFSSRVRSGGHLHNINNRQAELPS